MKAAGRPTSAALLMRSEPRSQKPHNNMVLRQTRSSVQRASRSASQPTSQCGTTFESSNKPSSQRGTTYQSSEPTSQPASAVILLRSASQQYPISNIQHPTSSIQHPPDAPRGPSSAPATPQQCPISSPTTPQQHPTHPRNPRTRKHSFNYYNPPRGTRGIRKCAEG